MGRATQDVKVGWNRQSGYKIADSGIGDNDINKPVKLDSTTDQVALAGDGDQIYGFIDSITNGTQDGKTMVGVCVSTRFWATLSGTASIGDIVVAAANTAAGTANAALGVVKVHTFDTTDVASLAASMIDDKWRIISGGLTDGSKVLLEKI